MKKILSVLMSAAMLLSLLAVSQTVLAAYTPQPLELDESIPYQLFYFDDRFCVEDEHYDGGYYYLEDRKYATFTPTADGLYEFTCTLEGSGRSIDFVLWDDAGREVDSSGYTPPQATYPLIVAQLNAGTTYQLGFCIVHVNDEWSGNIGVSLHTHVITQTITPAKIDAQNTWHNGSIHTQCSRCALIQKFQVISAPAKIKMEQSSFTYDGKAKKPKVTVYDKKGKVIAGSNYRVTTGASNKNVGIYAFSVQFHNDYYQGSLLGQYRINPPGTSIKTLRAGAKSFTVKWYKKTTQVSGYQIRYATNKDMKNAKTVTISNNSTVKKTIKKLKAKKKYYVQVRTYKTLLKNSSAKLYSKWSKAKAVTTK